MVIGVDEVVINGSIYPISYVYAQYVLWGVLAVIIVIVVVLLVRQRRELIAFALEKGLPYHNDKLRLNARVVVDGVLDGVHWNVDIVPEIPNELRVVHKKRLFVISRTRVEAFISDNILGKSEIKVSRLLFGKDFSIDSNDPELSDYLLTGEFLNSLNIKHFRMLRVSNSSLYIDLKSFLVKREELSKAFNAINYALIVIRHYFKEKNARRY